MKKAPVKVLCFRGFPCEMAVITGDFQEICDCMGLPIGCMASTVDDFIVRRSKAIV